jgi:phosphoadenylyl-sulfate reductase (thioredoxin)
MSQHLATRQPPLDRFEQHDLEHVNAQLADASPIEILEWAERHFPGKVTFATGFGPEGCVIIDMIARAGLTTDVFTLDTGLFFGETYDLWTRLEAHTSLTIRPVRPAFDLQKQAELYGEDLWKSDPDLCCTIRKVMPLQDALEGFDVWASAIRRDQTPDRANTPIVAYDPKFNLLKISPLATWSDEQVWDYIRDFNVPYNPLHEEGYPSIGCRPCTSAVKPGEAARAGRWRSHNKTECGLHTKGEGDRASRLRVI